MSYSNYNFDYRRNRIVEPSQLLASADIFHPTATQQYMLGCIFDTNDGRRFRYCKNAAVELAKALMNQSSAAVANWTEQTNTYGDAGSVGDTYVNINLATTATKDQFAGGWLDMVDATPAAALGDLYAIKGNDAGVSTTSGYNVKIYLADQGGLRNAITTSTQISVILNPYQDVVVVPAGAPTGLCIGVNPVIVTASYYFWAQTRGPAAILIDTDDVVVGDKVGEATTAGVDGCAGLIGDATDEPDWGVVMSEPTTAQTDQPAIVFLTLE